jgi:hypothetical protein
VGAADVEVKAFRRRVTAPERAGETCETAAAFTAQAGLDRRLE